MNQPEPSRAAEFAGLLDRLGEGLLTAAELARLDALAVAHVELRQQLREFLLIDSCLRWEFSAGIHQWIGQAVAVAPTATVATKTSRIAETAAAVRRLHRGASSSGWRLAASIAVVSLIFYGGMVALLWSLQLGMRAIMDRQVAQSATSWGELTADADAVWSPGSATSSSSAPGSQGSDQIYSLEQGRVELALAKGCTVVVAGPAAWRVLDDNALEFNRGTLRAVVPPSAHGFRVETPSATIVDLGTEFGVEVREDQSVLTQVMAGKVRVEGKGSTSALSSGNFEVAAGNTVEVRLGRPPQMTARTSRFDELLLDDRPSSPPSTKYADKRQTWPKLQQDPRLHAAYVAGLQSKREGEWYSAMPNNNRDAWRGVLQDAHGVKRGPLWVRTSDRHSYAPAAYALSFDGKDDEVLFPAHDFGGRFTIAAWIFPDGASRNQTQFIVGDLDATGRPYGFALVINSDAHLPRAPDFDPQENVGRLGFRARNGTSNVSVSMAVSERDCIQFNSWQHVVVTVDTERGQARIYRNGVEVTSIANSLANFSTTGPWRLGAYGNGQYGFHGLMDEVLVFNDVLAPSQVLNLFRGSDIEPSSQE